MKKQFVTLTAIIATTVLCAQNLTIDISVTENQRPISPYIYGGNIPTTNATAMRWGGNRTTTYNWENNYSNAGQDWNHASDGFLATSIPANERDIPGIVVLRNVQQAKSRNQYSLITLQAAGYVAADGNGIVPLEQMAPSHRWDSIVFRKGSELSLEPDRTDGKIFLDEYVNYLTQKLGAIGEGGIDGFGIDNEPALWASTHPRIRPEKLTIDEFFHKTVEIARIVKEFSPEAEVFGPMFYGWWDALHFNNIFPEWSSIRTANNYDWFVDYYLDSLRKVELHEGKRLLDVLAFHWYPEAQGRTTRKRVVNLDGTATAAQLIADDMVEARLQAPRAFWDEDYNSVYYLEVIFPGRVMLIPKLKQSIDTYYPGTKLAFTEFKFDAENHFSGGLAIADVLGIFGREGVYMANKWDQYGTFAHSAYNLYLNYDGEGSSFGSTSVKAQTNDNFTVSTVASIDENRMLRIVVINKTNQTQTSDFNLGGDYYSHAKVFGFDQTSSTVREFSAVSSISNNSFSYTLPAYSALLFEITPFERSSLITAQVIEGHDDKILVTASNPLQILNNAQAIIDFTVRNNNQEIPITGIEIGSNQNQVLLSLNTSIQGLDTLLYLHYSGESIHGISSLPILPIDSLYITNELAVAPFIPLWASTDKYGKFITLRVSKNIDVDVLSQHSIELHSSAHTHTIDSIITTDNKKELQIFISPRILIYDTIALSADPSFSAEDGSTASFSQYPVINISPRRSPVIDSIVINNNFIIQAYTDIPITFNHDNSGFIIKKDSEPISYSISSSHNIITFTLDEPLFKEYTYTISYIDNNFITTGFGGFLDGFITMPIENNLNPTPAPKAIPGIIQAQDLSYFKGNIQFETTSDISGDYHIGFITRDNIFGYTIDCQQAGVYTISLRHSGGTRNGQVIIRTTQDTLRSIYIPTTGNWNTWKNSAATIELTEGIHTIEIFVVNDGFNLNWFSIEEGDNTSKAEITSALTDNTGQSVYIYYDRLIETLPLATEISILVDGTPATITNIGYFQNNQSRLLFSLHKPILANQTITVSYSVTSARTSENGILQETALHPVQNRSTQTSSYIEERNHASIVHIYPNPVSVNTPFTIETLCNSPYIIHIYTITGVEIWSSQTTNSQSHKITLSEKGVYSIIVECNDYKNTTMIIVK